MRSLRIVCACLCLPALLFPLLIAAENESTGRLDEYRRYALEHPGEVAAGERLFKTHKQLACANCHVISGLEKSGPNLDGIADKYPRPELIRHILEPSAFIQPGYELATIVTKAGKIHSGRIRLVTKVEYRIFDAEGRLTRIPREEIEEIRAGKGSMMPDNVVTSITPAEFADLIAYLATLRSAVQTGFIGPNEPVEIPKLKTPVQLKPIHPASMKFATPVQYVGIPGQPRQGLVLEHLDGKAWRLDRSGNETKRHVFLDLQSEIAISPNQGLLCLAFHPQYAKNGRYFLKHQIHEAGAVKSVVVERRADESRLADSGTASRRLLETVQPAFNHNGGCLEFGPDGMLYIAFGDGGPQKDPNGYSQNPRDFLGSFLRIDVDRRDEGLEYGIPPDNPWVAAHRVEPAIRPETWAIGFREPWRFTFDKLTGDLWLGDVGQDKWEEVSIVRRGENHGWNVYEAWEVFSNEFRRPGEVFTPPLFAYPRSLGVSVTGGYVYRADPKSSWYGVYVFGDYESRRLWGLTQKDGRVTAIREIANVLEHIASFGTDDAGEIYLVSYEGTVSHVDLSRAKFE